MGRIMRRMKQIKIEQISSYLHFSQPWVNCSGSPTEGYRMCNFPNLGEQRTAISVHLLSSLRVLVFIGNHLGEIFINQKMEMQ